VSPASMDRRRALQAAGLLALGAPLAACGSSDPDWHAAPPGAPHGSSPAPAGSAGTAPTGSPGPTNLALPPEVVHGPADRAAVALTFHGQGSPAQAEAVLAELENGGARATVMAVGSWLAANPTIARRIVDAGHELGNHTQNHGPISQMGAAQAFAEIDGCAQVLRRLTGTIGTWFRPSQTQYSTAGIREQAQKVGYPTCLSYDLDSLDYTDPGSAAVVRNVTSAAHNGSIVSLHFGHAGTVEAVPQILAGLAARGLKPVTMTELMRP
jgi:peptidoglycan/xylan/chitin deacetylase (PgdA/CDA1 family)